MSRSQISRRILATAASVALTIWLASLIRPGRVRLGEGLLELSIALAPALAAGVSWLRPTIAQLFSRATWWAYLLGGCLAAGFSQGRLFAQTCLFVVVANAVALLSLGRLGLEEKQGVFAPVAFRGTFIMSLVLAIADAGVFLWMGVATLGDHLLTLPLVLSLAMFAGAIGLYRLRTWGLLVSLATNLIVIVCAATDWLGLPGPLRKLFAATAIVQVLIPVPMLVSLVRGERPAARPRWEPRYEVVAPWLVLGLAVFGSYLALRPHGLLGFVGH